VAQQTVFRGTEGRVGFAELFFDLVFVFAITQVSHHLLYHFDRTGAVQATLIFLAVWWVWIYTTWVLNRLDPERFAVRMLLFALMLLGLFLSMSIPQAFGDRALVFAATYVAMQAGRTAFVWVHAAGDDRLRSTYLRILIWFLAAALFWIGGALLPPGARLAVWTLALAVEYLGPAAGFAVPGLGRDVTQNWTVKGGHMAERCGLFVIIALGETLLVSGATFADAAWTGPGVGAFLGSVVLSIAMWWVYFHIGHHRATHQIETSDDPGRIARLSFTYAHIPIVAGVVLSAVGCERAIAHPSDPGHMGDLLTLLGGNVLFLAGNGWFKRLSARWFPLSHLVGIGLSAALFVAGFWLPLSVSMALGALVLIVVAVWEHRSLRGGAH
jgi:low temperature requirement protein LtrA